MISRTFVTWFWLGGAILKGLVWALSVDPLAIATAKTGFWICLGVATILYYQKDSE